MDSTQLTVRSAKAWDLAHLYAAAEGRSVDDILEAALVEYAIEKHGEEFVKAATKKV